MQSSILRRALTGVALSAPVALAGTAPPSDLREESLWHRRHGRIPPERLNSLDTQLSLM